MEQFYKLYYEEKPYVYTDDDGNESREVFKGADYQDIDFSVTVEAGGGTQFSEAMTISLLGDLFQSQSIDLSTYVELFPDSAMPFKGTLKKQLQAREESENAQLKAALQQAQAQIEQLTAYVKEQETAVQNTSSVVRQNRQLNELLGKLQTEYKKSKAEMQSNISSIQAAKKQEEIAENLEYADYMFGQYDPNKSITVEQLGDLQALFDENKTYMDSTQKVKYEELLNAWGEKNIQTNIAPKLSWKLNNNYDYLNDVLNNAFGGRDSVRIIHKLANENLNILDKAKAEGKIDGKTYDVMYKKYVEPYIAF